MVDVKKIVRALKGAYPFRALNGNHFVYLELIAGRNLVIMRMQEFMCFFAERFTDKFLVECLNLRILMGLANGKIPVNFIEGFHALLTYGICRANRLPAAA